MNSSPSISIKESEVPIAGNQNFDGILEGLVHRRSHIEKFRLWTKLDKENRRKVDDDQEEHDNKRPCFIILKSNKIKKIEQI
jgi:hypothetical protein